MQKKQVKVPKGIAIQTNLQDTVKIEEKILVMENEDNSIMKIEDRTIIKEDISK
jgi:hypothetical protein